MARESSRAANRAAGAGIIILLSCALAFIGAKTASYVVAHGETALTELFINPLLAFEGPLLAVDLSDWRVAGIAAACAAVPLLMVMMFGVTRQKLPNEDTGKEHGDDRLATVKEMRSALDEKHFYNNIIYSDNTGIVLNPYNKKTRAAVDGRNLNTCTFGISGLGKTFNLVKPNIMQAVGDALPERPYGLRNAPAHLAKTRAAMAVSVAVETIRILKAQSRHAPEAPEIDEDDYLNESLADDAAERLAEELSAQEDSLSSMGKEEGKEEIQEPRKEETRKEGKGAEAGEPGPERAEEPSSEPAREHVQEKPYSLRNAVAEARRKVAGAERARKAAKLGDGFDIVNTDPKGDNVRDVGWMLLAAGFDVKVVNTIDFEEGLHVNPLSYIGTRLVDIKQADALKTTVTARAPEEAKPGAPLVKKSVTVEGPGGSKADSTAEWTVEAKPSLSTETVSLSETPRPTLSSTEIDDLLASGALNAEERELLTAQRDMLWMESDMGSYVIRDASPGAGADESYRLVPGNGCSKVASAIESMRYRRTSGQLIVEFTNRSERPVAAELTIELDDALVVTGIPEYTSGTIDFVSGEPGGTVRWTIPAAIPKSPDAAPGMLVSERVVFDVHIRPTKVADGVWLTKTVDCLCTNLRGTDAASNNTEDPFWEDTKRLCFMSLIALLFERYDDSQHTLPEMMKLLNIALDESQDPNVKSPLSVLMEMWEYGRIFEATPTSEGGGGGHVRGGRWVPSGNPPHSRNDSMALHCFHAFMSGAPETKQSIVISCQAALVNLLSEDVKEMLSYDELHLETLGDADQKQAIFIVTKDTDSPFDFITALITFQAIDIAQEKAYKRYGGKLPRHVRFEFDEVANIGKIPILIRAMAVVRSRNISISMYLQSKAQLAMVYGEKEAEVILDNCSAILFLGAQTKDTLEEMSVKVGVETVQSRVLQRSAQDNSLIGSMSEQVSSNERRVMSSSQLARMTKGWMMVFLFNERAAYDHKFQTLKHPLYAYIDPESSRRDWRMPEPVFTERFDYARYRRGDYDEKIAAMRAELSRR